MTGQGKRLLYPAIVLVLGFFAAFFFYTSKAVSQSSPAAPSSLAATAVSSSKINLSWQDTANENGFLIYRSKNSNLSNATIFQVAANVVSFSDTGLAAETIYYYQVYACNDAGCTASNIASAATKKNLPNPNQTVAGGGAIPVPDLQNPAVLSDSACGVGLNWNYSGDSQNITFDLKRNGVVIAGIANAPASSYVNEQGNPAGMAVNPGTLYSYQIQARNTQTGDFSGYSTPVKSITTPSLSGLLGFNKPGAPVSLLNQTRFNGNIYTDWAIGSPSSAFFPAYGKFKIVWSSSNDGVTYGADNTTGEVPLEQVSGSNPAKYFYEFTAPDKDSGYRLNVYTKEVGGKYCDPTNTDHYLLSDPSSQIVIPPRPGSFTGNYSSSPREVNLKWADRARNEDYFLIMRSTSLSGGDLVNPISFPNQPADSTSYKDKSVDPAVSKIYYYTIQACRTGGACSFATAPLMVPVGVVVPQNFKAVVTSLSGGKVSVSLIWTGDPIFGQTYTIQRKIGDTGNFADIALAANLSADQFVALKGTFLDKDLAQGSVYFYRIKVAKNNEIDYTVTASVKTDVTPVKGWAWGGHGLGWIRLSSDSVSSAWGGALGAPDESATPYGIFIDKEGFLSGYAWSSYGGWLSFNAADLDGCPAAPCEAGAHLLDGEVRGWAKFTTDGVGRGLDRWVSLSSKVGEPGYGLYYSSLTEGNAPVGQLRGFSWGGDVAGWITFGGPILKNVTQKKDGSFDVTYENQMDYSKVEVYRAKEGNPFEVVSISAPTVRNDTSAPSHTVNIFIPNIQSNTNYQFKVRGYFP